MATSVFSAGPSPPGIGQKILDHLRESSLRRGESYTRAEISAIALAVFEDLQKAGVDFHTANEIGNAVMDGALAALGIEE